MTDILVDKVKEHEVTEVSNQLTFNGMFSGSETELRITDDKQWVSAFDLIKLVGEKKTSKKTWYDIEKQYPEVGTICSHWKFKGARQKDTPVLNAKGVVMVLQLIPGRIAAQFRMQCGDIIVRYLGGDQTLIQEIQTINQYHEETPNNPLQLFRQDETVQGNLGIFNQDQINHSKKLIAHFGDKMNIMYLFSFMYLSKWFGKIGSVRGVREFHNRVTENKSDFGDIAFHSAIQCSDIEKVESDFKNTALFKMNQAKNVIQNKNGGFHSEVFYLSETATLNTFAEEMIKTAGDRIIDPPPLYSPNIQSSSTSLEVEQEKTKQKEEETKQEELKTRQMEIQSNTELEKLRLTIELQKLSLQVPSKPTVQQKIQTVNPEPQQKRRKENNHEASKRILNELAEKCQENTPTRMDKNSPWECKYCINEENPYIHLRLSKMRDHIYNHHLDYREFECNECGHASLNQSHYKAHLEMHERKRKFDNFT
ncbi:MAG: hypothetical protein PHX34_04480 [Candidatus Shapirobacteria bacterium]|nr:hypothetical protein [Candidatus Shapirobacteria bacterium]